MRTGLMAGTLTVLVLLVAAPARAQDFAALEKIYVNECLKTQDLDGLAADLTSLAQSHAGRAEGWLALQRLMDIRRELADQQPAFAMLQGHAADNFARCGVYADDYADAYLELARDFVPDQSWHVAARRWGGLTAASWIGPFAESGPAAHDDAFAPEVLADFARPAQGAFGPVAWTSLRPVEDIHGEIDLGAQARWMGCGYYAAFGLVAGTQRDVVFKPRFNGPGKLWLNGQLLADMDTRARDYGRPWLKATLRRGQNVLLVKLSSVSPLVVRMRAPDGSIPQGIVNEAPAAAFACAGIAPAVAAYPPQLESLGQRVPANARQTAALRLALAAGHAAHGLHDEATELFESALAAAPDDPLVRLAWLGALAQSPLHGSGERRRLETALLDDLCARHPDFAPALFARASLFIRDERWQDAQEALDKAAPTAPAWRVELARAELFQRAGWRAENLAALKRAYAARPDALPVLQTLARHWNWRGLPHAQVEYDRAIVARVPAHRDAVASLVSALLRTAQPEEALKFARLQAAQDPTGDYTQSRLAAALAACGKLDEAVAVYDRMAARTGRPEAAWQEAARMLLQHGDTGRARHYLDKVVSASPAEHTARRQLERLNNFRQDFWTQYALPLEEALKHDIRPADFPRADSALILDEMVQIVYPDGSSRSYVHQARRILTQEGVDQRGKEDINGELVLARTIKADGTVLEPITFSGNQVEFPGVEVGCLIEMAWLIQADANPWCTLMGDRFFFSDQKLAEPFAISRWVLITPRGMPLGIRSHNLPDGAGPAAFGSAGGHTKVHVWDVRRPQHPQAEDFSPSALETIPWVEVTQPRDWRRKGRETAERGLNLGRGITGLVRTKAAEICGDAASDEQKARRIYAWVNEKLTTRGESFHPHQSLKAEAGDRQELFVCLCLTAGVKLGFACADYAPEYKPAVDDDLPDLNWAYVRDEDFPLFLVVVTGDNGAPVYVDLGDRLRPFGQLSARRSRAPVIRWQDGRFTLGQLPATDADSDRFENRATIALAADGSATIEGSISIFGDRAWGLKDMLRTQPSDEMQTQLEGELAGLYAGLDLESFSAPDLAVPGKPLVRAFKGKVDSLAQAQDGRLTLKLPMENLGQLLSALCNATERRTALLLNFDLHQRDELVIQPPSGWRFAALPQGLVYPTAPMLYSLQFEMIDGAMVVRRSLALGPGRIEPALYAQLTAQVKQIGDAETVTLELEKAP